jgi:hypothetical protein
MALRDFSFYFLYPHRRINKTVSILLSAWYEPAELAQLSLAGKACPSIRGSLPKPKFAEDILEAIESTSSYSPTEFKLISFFLLFLVRVLDPKMVNLAQHHFNY